MSIADLARLDRRIDELNAKCGGLVVRVEDLAARMDALCEGLGVKQPEDTRAKPQRRAHAGA